MFDLKDIYQNIFDTISHTQYSSQIFHDSVVVAPLTVYGRGSYALSSVKEVTGTEEYLKKAERGGQCQNKETILECRERQFQQGVTQCGCVPFNLRNFAAKVGDLTYNMTVEGVS